MTDRVFDLHFRQTDATIATLNASTAKRAAENESLIAETAELSTQTRRYVAVVASGATLALVAMAKPFL
ncbi:hypothetical protein [Roseivivax sp. CAU 1761]